VKTGRGLQCGFEKKSSQVHCSRRSDKVDVCHKESTYGLFMGTSPVVLDDDLTSEIWRITTVCA